MVGHGQRWARNEPTEEEPMLFAFLTLMAVSDEPVPAPVVRLESPVVNLGLVLKEQPLASTDVVNRIELANDTPLRLRVMQPLWQLSVPVAATCTLFAETPKITRVISEPTPVTKDYLLFRFTDLTIAPGERLILAIQCDNAEPTTFTLTQSILGEAGPLKALGLAKRNTPP